MKIEGKCKKCKVSMPVSENKCPSCGAKQISPLLMWIVIWALVLALWALPTKQKVKTPIKEYNYVFVEENKQLTWECLRSEWVYQVPNWILNIDIESILYEIYEKKKWLTDRTNISIYTESALENIKNDVADTSIWFLNDGFNCKNPRNIIINNNWSIYNATR